MKGNALSWNSRAYILSSFSVAPCDELKSFKFIFGPEEMTEETEEWIRKMRKENEWKKKIKFIFFI